MFLQIYSCLESRKMSFSGSVNSSSIPEDRRREQRLARRRQREREQRGSLTAEQRERRLAIRRVRDRPIANRVHA